MLDPHKLGWGDLFQVWVNIDLAVIHCIMILSTAGDWWESLVSELTSDVYTALWFSVLRVIDGRVLCQNWRAMCTLHYDSQYCGWLMGESCLRIDERCAECSLVHSTLLYLVYMGATLMHVPILQMIYNQRWTGTDWDERHRCVQSESNMFCY